MIKKILIILLMLLVIPLAVMGAGICEFTQEGSSPGAEHNWRHYTCTADATGDVAPYTVKGFYDFYLYSVETWPGDATADATGDFTLVDATTGEDLTGGNGTDAIASVAKTIAPKSTAMGVNFNHLVKGNLTLNITDATVDSIMNVRVTGVK